MSILKSVREGIEHRVEHYGKVRAEYQQAKEKAEMEYAPKRARMEVEEKFNQEKKSIRSGQATGARGSVGEMGRRIQNVFGGGSVSGDASKILGGGSGYNSNLGFVGIGGGKRGQREEPKDLANISAGLFGGKKNVEPVSKKPKKIVTRYF